MIRSTGMCEGVGGARGRALAAALLFAGALAASPARACWDCDGYFCVVSAAGARACFGGFGGCVAWGACGGDSGPLIESDGAMALQLTWIEAGTDAGDPAAGPRVARGVGRRAFGAAAVRAFRAANGGGGGAAPVVAAIAGFGAAFDVVLRSEADDGVRLAWAAEGRGGRVTIREPGSDAVIADERLAESDALVVPVRHGGRDYALVVQPRVLPRLSVRLETEDLARASRDAVRPGRTRLAIAVADATR